MTKKAISLAEFNELSRTLQLDLLQRHGVYVGKRNINDQKVILFQLHTFYVEVFFIAYRKEVDFLNISNDPLILQPYIQQVYIKDLDQDKEK